MTGQKITIILALIACCCILLISGCDEPVQKTGRAFLSVDFDTEKPLRYKAVSNRTIILDWNPNKKDKKAKKKYVENCEMTIRYETVELDPYGLSTIKATFEDVRVDRNNRSRKNALTALKGKSFTFTVGPNGKIHDDADFFNLLKDASQQVFRKGKGDQRIKDPDILDDAIAVQYQLWNAPAAIEKPAEGLKKGQTWESDLFIPSSMILRQAIGVTYKLREIQQTEKGQIAVIGNNYNFSDQKSGVPIPYEGNFQLAGSFGFFRSMFKGLSVRAVQGTGQQMYDLDAGQVKSSEQNYTVTIKPNAVPMPGTDPVITVQQKTTITLLEN